MLQLPVISSIDMDILKLHLITSFQLIECLGTSTTVTYFVEVSLILMLVDIWRSFSSLGPIDNLFQPFLQLRVIAGSISGSLTGWISTGPF